MERIEFRSDRGRLNKVEPIAGGGIRIDAALTRVGVFEYQDAAGNVSRELKPPEEVFNAKALAGLKDAPVTADLPDAPVEALVDADQITQVLHNLLQNARDAAREAHPSGGGTVTLRLRENAGAVTIEVQDNGACIAASETVAIFEPYYTRKEGGTRLGLAITQRIVTEHGGRIDVESRVGTTMFTVVLPRR